MNNLTLLGCGLSGRVYAIDEDWVIKVSNGGERNDLEQAIERKIYERIGEHDRFVKYFGLLQGSLVLERMKEQLRLHLQHLREAHQAPSTEFIIRWAMQMAEGLEYLHDKDILQVDMGCHNILLDAKGDAKFCDFAGSSIDGETATIAPSCHSQHPTDRWDTPHNVVHELFAFGSALYEISTAWQPYSDKADEDIEKLFEEGIFPDTSHLLLDGVIQECWHGHYQNAQEVRCAIDRIKSSQNGMRARELLSRYVTRFMDLL